jgi:hypothetical protein
MYIREGLRLILTSKELLEWAGFGGFKAHLKAHH